MPDVLIGGTTPSIQALIRASGSIPIVMVGITDPVGSGIILSLARPGGNVTGLSRSAGQPQGPKLLELLEQIVPGLRRVAVLFESESAPSVEDFHLILAAAQSAGIEAQAIAVASADELAPALDGALAGHPQALILATVGPIVAVKRPAIAEFALTHGLPSASEPSTWAGFGGLMSYGPDDPAMYRRAGNYYVDRILRGAKPADLPVEQPTTFDFVVNRTTAQALGITIPPSIAQQVTQWIE